MFSRSFVKTILVPQLFAVKYLFCFALCRCQCMANDISDTLITNERWQLDQQLVTDRLYRATEGARKIALQLPIRNKLLAQYFDLVDCVFVAIKAISFCCRKPNNSVCRYVDNCL